MFKLVVLCAFVASAVAEPGLLASQIVQPYAAYSSIVQPATTSYSSQSSSVIHPSPLYSAPLVYSHFIKKRAADPQFLATPYSAQYNYFPYNIPAAPVVATSPIVQTPFAYNTAALPVSAHLIKKRSAPLLAASTYIAPTTYLSNSAISTPLIASPYYQTPYAAAQIPLVNTHFIKKRSAEPTAEPAAEPAAEPQTFFPNSYYTPSTYFNTVAATPYYSTPLVNNYYTAPGFPLATTHLIKKRSAEPTPEADPEAKADPAHLAYSTYPATYYSSPALLPTYTSPAFFKAAPFIPANPFVYSTFIKK